MGTYTDRHIVHTLGSIAGALQLPHSQFEVLTFDLTMPWPEAPVVLLLTQLEELERIRLNPRVVEHISNFGIIVPLRASVGEHWSPRKRFSPLRFDAAVYAHDRGKHALEMLRQLSCPKLNVDWEIMLMQFIDQRYRGKPLPAYPTLENIFTNEQRQAHVRKCAGCQWRFEIAAPLALDKCRLSREMEQFRPRSLRMQGGRRSRMNIPSNPRLREMQGQRMPDPLIGMLAGMFAAFMDADIAGRAGQEPPWEALFGQRRTSSISELGSRYGKIPMREFINRMADLGLLNLDYDWDRDED